ncbi:conjugal transfer protein TraA [Vibrio mimicus]|nr:conjugal transfer protein TraA [Vibrio mimicus]
MSRTNFKYRKNDDLRKRISIIISDELKIDFDFGDFTKQTLSELEEVFHLHLQECRSNPRSKQITNEELSK